MDVELKVVKCPTDSLVLTNCVIVNIKDLDVKNGELICIGKYIFNILNNEIPLGEIGLNVLQRKWINVSLNQKIKIHQSHKKEPEILKILITFCVYKKNIPVQNMNIGREKMIEEFYKQFKNRIFTEGEELFFKVENYEVYHLIIKHIKIHLSTLNPEGILFDTFGKFVDKNSVIFEYNDPETNIINSNWDFNEIGIGGLDKEFSSIFRRAFASRIFPPHFIENLGMKHVKGMLLYGPPGTGKTLIARQISKMLNTVKPKIINGPSILSKWVGESEKNIRELFSDAEQEEKKMGINSKLHVIIFDEIDAICQKRGNSNDSSGIRDSVINQLLSKIDGMDQLNNVLIIGMTNRIDIIDEALLRPGRLEIQIEIGLPNEIGRLQIFEIHTKLMSLNKKLSEDVDLEELSKLTNNFTGAEIEGLVRASQSLAMNRLINLTNVNEESKDPVKVKLEMNAVERMQIVRDDFIQALQNDIKPQFGQANEILDRFINGDIIIWSQDVQDILNRGNLLVEQILSPDTKGLVSLLIEGVSNSGKTALAATIAKNSEVSFIRVCSPEDMIGYNEQTKCNILKKTFDDAYKSLISIIIIDDIERLLDYGPIGFKYSNLILQTLLVLLKKQPPHNNHLLVIGTTSNRDIMESLEVTKAFTSIVHVFPLTTINQIVLVLEHINLFDDEEIEIIKNTKNKYFIGIKTLLEIIDSLKVCKLKTLNIGVDDFIIQLEETNLQV
uniref:Vesicle-fusing ATPase n=1 Tax=viral metagenome TaxID=1070528 RepID=A0A6C0JSY2_9ZZZZ